MFFMSSVAQASELVWGFKNPSFSGQGYSAHVLSSEQLSFNRKQDIKDKAEAEARRIERELENSILNKFIRNVESRIYAQLSKQMVDAMFADCTDTCSNTGTAEIEGSIITWVKADGMITITIVQEDGTVTEITIPAEGDFSF
ncbi:MAG: curli assembly protein CsgF [Euryarchaeota archaeon]